MTEKVKIGQDQTRQNFLQFQVEDGIVSINQTIKSALQEIGFDLTNETLQDCYSGCKDLHRSYFKTLAKDLAAVSTPSTRSLLDKNAGESWEKFKNTLATALGKVTGAARGYITIINGLAVYPDSAKEKLLEDCAIYLLDPEEIELHRLHLEACDALNAFFQGHRTTIWQQLFEIGSDGKFTITLANYQYILQRIKQLKSN